ncbi:MAG: amidohydrolase family protein [Acidobacteria bacterium]|nr:amidohydrolase family protein [Acidobacteriota bacterium]
MKRTLLVVIVAMAALAAQPSTQAPAVTAIRGGTVFTITRGVIQNGVVVLRDGKIAAVGGADTAVPAGADVIDATGRFVTPGLIDAHSHIAAASINEGGTTVSSMTGMADVLDPADVNIHRDLAGGLTTANVLHGSANPIGGTNSVIKLRWGAMRPSDLIFEGAMPGIKFALGENPKDLRPGGGGVQESPRRYPITRPGVEYVIRDAFTRARVYQKAWRDYEAARKTNATLLPPRRDLQLDPLVEILEGRRLVHAHGYRADEHLMLLRLAEDFGFKVATLQHVVEGYKFADEIMKHGAGASTWSDWWVGKIEAQDSIPYNAALMVRRGVLVSINSDSAEHARRLNTEAAKTIHWGGLSEDEALTLVTMNPARQLRIDNRVGSLEPGKDADVVIWNRHPLSTYAIVDRVYIDGRVYYDRANDEQRLTDARAEKSRLMAAEGRPGTGSPAQVPQPQPRAGDADRSDAAGAGGPSAESATSNSSMRTTQAALPVPTSGPVTLITNARIHTMTGNAIESGSILIRGGVIAQVQTGAIQAPAGAQVVDAKGADVYPGFIDARTTIGIAEPGARGFDDVVEMLDVNAAVKAQVSYKADSDAIGVARVNGITSVAVVPSGGLVGGQVAVMNLDGWTWEEATLKPTAGVSVQFPGLTPRGGGQGNAPRKYEELKRDRDARIRSLEDVIARARAYARVPAAERRTDWNLEALVPVVEGRQPLFVNAGIERDIRDAVAFADRAGVRIVITGGLEAPLAADALKAKDIPVILGSVLTLPDREDAHHAATYRAAGELARAGVRFAFGSGGYTNVRLIPYEAGISVAWGLSRDQALRAITIDAAEILGVADRVGTIEPGKLANLAIWNGDPLEFRTPVPRVFIAGRDVGPASVHTDLYDKWRSRPLPATANGRPR